MPKKLKEVLADAGVSMENEAGGHAPKSLTDREIKKAPHPRVEKLRDVFMQTLSSANNEFPYWYTREYFQHDNEIPVVRRAMALKAAFSHTTPVIFPGELLVMHKAPFFRGSFPMPWLSEGYYMAKEDELYQDALKRGSTSVDEHSKFGQGGGNVVKSFGKVVSVAGKFGVRQEEIPALLKIARSWVGKSVDDLGHKYEVMVPGYETKEAIMRNIVCMFDSGYTLPQGREVINYYYPLHLGFDGIINLAKEMKAKVAGRADGDGLTGHEPPLQLRGGHHRDRGPPGLGPQLREGSPPPRVDREGRRPEGRVQGDRRAPRVARAQRAPDLHRSLPDDRDDAPGRPERGRHLGDVPGPHRRRSSSPGSTRTSRRAGSPRTRSSSSSSSTAS